MEQVGDLVVRAAIAPALAQRVEAYGRLVERFRDMACGYAYSIVGDFHLAEDVAQEAFIVAFGKLGQLQRAEAFPGWFRRIVWSACGRLTRRKAVEMTGLDAAESIASPTATPHEAAEQKEMRDEVLKAIRELPEPQREAMALFYINGYSQKDIADFLEVPVGTVKNRLNASRSRLKERMLGMVKEALHQNAPDERFDKTVIEDLLSRPKPLEIPGHPMHAVWDDFRACFPDFQVVDFTELLARKESHLTADVLQRFGYGVGDNQILRTDLSDQLVHHWIGQGGGTRGFITAGRTFRKGDLRDPRRSSNVFHQAEVLWVGSGFSEETPVELARKIVPSVIGKELAKVGEPGPVGGGVIACELCGEWRGKLLEFGVAGFYSQDVVRGASLDPDVCRALCLCIGLERCALIRYDLDDIRQLWQPPYVPG